MSAFGKHGVRCDWCGKFTNARDGEYTRPVKNEHGVNLAGYIRIPDWEREDDQGNDICEECVAGVCPHCGSDQIVKITPATPGPTGWGGRCKVCGKRWDMPMPSGEQYPAPRRRRRRKRGGEVSKPKPKAKRKIPACQMTMGEWGNYFECGKPSKYIVTDRLRGRLFVCGIHKRFRSSAVPIAAPTETERA